MTPEETIKQKEMEKRRQEQRLANAYQRAFATEDGRVVLADLRQLFRLEQRVFTPVRQGGHYGYDPLTAALADGARGVVIYIQERLATKVQGDANIENAPEKVIKP